MKIITVDIVDDHQMIIGGLKEMIKNITGIEVANTYNNGFELLIGLQLQQPDVLLLDIQMPSSTGDELAAVISRSYPSIKILTITGFNTADYALLMLEKGASGYLLKNTDEHKLRLAIETVYNGGKYIESSILEKINEKNYGQPRGKKPSLNKREKDILQMILDEKTNQQIADTLNISLRTVEYHRMSLIQKFDAKNIVGMVKRAYELGVIGIRGVQ